MSRDSAIMRARSNMHPSPYQRWQSEIILRKAPSSRFDRTYPLGSLSIEKWAAKWSAIERVLKRG